VLLLPGLTLAKELGHDAAVRKLAIEEAVVRYAQGRMQHLQKLALLRKMPLWKCCMFF
jgi:hypothetical protein